MARVIPAGNISADDWEKSVINALKSTLGDDFTIYRNVLMSGRRVIAGSENKQHFAMHESDVVVVSPTHGILLVEVKGKSLELQDDGNWAYVSGGQRSPADHPVEQAQRNLNTLKEHLFTALKRKTIPFPYGYAIVFPGHSMPLNKRPMWYSGDNIFLKEDLPHLGEKVRRCLREWNQLKRATTINPEIQTRLDDIFKCVQPPMGATHFPDLEHEVIKSLFVGEIRAVEDANIRGTALKMDELTTDQAKLVLAAEENPRLLVRGMAGSGKTVVAVDQACRLADQGLKVLFLCYNTALGKHVARTVSSTKGIHAISFYQFVNDTLRKAGMEPIKKPMEDYWGELPALELDKALTELRHRGTPVEYDAIVVDEAQDFHEIWWEPLEAMIRATEIDGDKIKRLSVYYDPNQNLFDRKQTATADIFLPNTLLQNMMKITLRHNCRNTKRIARYVELITQLPFPSMNKSPEGKDPLFHDMMHNWQSTQSVLCNQVNDWLTQGCELKDIAIACYHKQANKIDIGKIRVTEDIEEWRDGKAILFTTVRGFKGLEAEALILFDIPEPGKKTSYTLKDHYVAVSRAKQRLALFVRKEFVRPSVPLDPETIDNLEA
jgi:hypothetical protein